MYDDINWRKSRRSGNSMNCVETATVPVGVLVRDTKQDGQPGRTVLAFTAGAWAAFTDGIKGGAVA